MGQRAGRRHMIDHGAIDGTILKANAREPLKLLETPLRAETIRREIPHRRAVNAKQSAVSGNRPSISRTPIAMVVPVTHPAFAAVLMPGQRFMRGEEVIAQCPSPHTSANFFRVEISMGIYHYL